MKTETLTFRALSETDLLLLHNWFQKPHVKEWYARDVHYTPAMIREKYLPRILDPKSIPNFIIYADDIPIGYMQLYSLKHSLPDGVDNYSHPLFVDYNVEKIAGIDFFIAETDYLNKGYASVALENFIDTQIRGRFSVVVSDPLKENNNAICFLERNGFKKFVSNSPQSINELMVFNVSAPSRDR
jgi:RimJ/RimL family protein N-acetyltransferase